MGLCTFYKWGYIMLYIVYKYLEMVFRAITAGPEGVRTSLVLLQNDICQEKDMTNNNRCFPTKN